MKHIILITGGTGFIGSHLIDRLITKNKVRVIDKLSSEYLKSSIKSKSIDFHKHNLLKENSKIFNNVDEVFHFAALSDIRSTATKPKTTFKENVDMTLNVLESCRKNDVQKIIFASTSTVYGIAKIPTPENHIVNPISIYAASKVACEACIQTYSNFYGIDAIILRYANIFGPRTKKSVVRDFFYKLMEKGKRLEILGNGKQNKSYLYIDDCIDATLCAVKNSNGYEIYNVGHEEQITVDDIALEVINAMGLSKVKFVYTGGEQGWAGDVPNMLLDISKLKELGWSPKISIKEGIKKYIEYLKQYNSKQTI